MPASRPAIRLLASVLILGAAWTAEENPPPLRAGLAGDRSLAAIIRDAGTVSTASRYAEDIAMAPNIMYVYSQEQIRTLGLQNLGDLLDITPGFKVFHKDLQRVAQVRGVVANDNEKITVMINGHSINNVVEPEFLNGPLNLQLARQVEVLVGPGSVLYGADTMAGAVNILTRQIDGLEGMVSVGSRGRATVSAIGGAGLEGGGNLTVSATVMKQDGYDASAGIDPSRQSPPPYDGSHLGQLYPSGFLTARAVRGPWTFQVLSQNSRQVSPEFPGAIREDTINAMDTGWERPLTSALSVYAQARYDHQRMQRRNLGGAVAPTGNVFTSFDLTEVKYGGEAGLRLKDKWQRFQVGVQYTLKEHDSDYLFIWDPTRPGAPGSSISSINTPRSTEVVGGYISEDFTPSDRLKLTAALRGDRDSILGDGARVYFSPRAAVAWRVTDLWTSKAMYNTATRMPSVWASPENIYYQVVRPPSWQNYPADRPERLTAYEVENILQLDDYHFSVNGFYQEISDFMTWGRPFTNIGDYRGFGAEADARGPLTDRLSAWLNASWSQPRFDASVAPSSLPPATNGALSQQDLPWTPRFTVNLGLELDVGADTTISPVLRSFFRMRNYDTNNGANIINPPEESYDRAYLDLNVRTIDAFGLRHLETGVAVRNVTNNRLAIPQVYQNKLISAEPVVVTATAYYSF